MKFRDLKKQYDYIRTSIDRNMQAVINNSVFIGGHVVEQLESLLASYVGVKYCISCANGTDALQLGLMAWKIGRGDAVFVPDFTFFSSGEVVSAVGATPIFVDVKRDTFNIDTIALEKQIQSVKEKGILEPKAVIAVDLFGQPAEYDTIREIADKYGLYVLEDGAQGFGGSIGGKKVCSFGDISTTSFFPAKPLGCYGDGGAIFTDDDEWAAVIKSLKVHGKGTDKYDNIRIGMNSRLDSIQAAVLVAKLPVFTNEEMIKVQWIAQKYTELLHDTVMTPVVKHEYTSSWAQYTIQLPDQITRDGLQGYLKDNEIPSAVYYQKPMHKQRAFADISYQYSANDFSVTDTLCKTVLSLPFHPYMTNEDIEYICSKVKEYLSK